MPMPPASAAETYSDPATASAVSMLMLLYFNLLSPVFLILRIRQCPAENCMWQATSARRVAHSPAVDHALHPLRVQRELPLRSASGSGRLPPAAAASR